MSSSLPVVQPVRALDQFGRTIEYLRISVTDRCNFRCVYCMPEKGMQWLPKSEILSYEEITEVVRQLAAFSRLLGRPPTHIDSHQHAHRNEPARSLVSQAAQQLSVPVRSFTPRVEYCGDFYGQTGEGDPYPEGISLEGLLRQYGVNLAFTGHSHTYERNIASAAGLVNYVNGGGGATLGTLGLCLSPFDAYAISFNPSGKACGSAPVPTSPDQVYHFSLVTLNGALVTVSPTNALGHAFDVHTYDFSAGLDGIAPSVPAATLAHEAFEYVTLCTNGGFAKMFCSKMPNSVAS